MLVAWMAPSSVQMADRCPVTGGGGVVQGTRSKNACVDPGHACVCHIAPVPHVALVHASVWSDTDNASDSGGYPECGCWSSSQVLRSSDTKRCICIPFFVRVWFSKLLMAHTVPTPEACGHPRND